MEANLVDKHPQVKILPSSMWSPLVDFQNKSYNMSGEKFPEKVLVIKVEPYQYAFMYCDIVRQENVSEWFFSLFLDPFDNWSWLLLLTVSLEMVPHLENFHL